MKNTIKGIQIKQKCIKCKEYFVYVRRRHPYPFVTQKICTDCTTMSEIVKQFLTKDSA